MPFLISRTRLVFLVSRHGLSALFLFAVTLLFSWGHRSWERPEHLGNPKLDAPKMFYPLRAWGFEQVRQGQIPLWNPMILCGMPNVAEMQSAIFYPPNLLFALLGPAEAYNACVILHLFLSGIFTYTLLIYYGSSRAAGIAAGITYMLCGPQITHLFAGHLTIACVIAWAPLLVLLFDRAVRQPCWKAGMFGAAALDAQLLAGYPQCALYSIHTVSLLGLGLAGWKYRKDKDGRALAKRLLILALSLSMGFALASVQLFPAWEFVPYSVRGEFSYEWSATHSLPPENLLTFFVPEFFGSKFYWGREFQWESTAYVGIVALFLAAVAAARPRRPIILFFAGLATLTVLLALSRYTPLSKVAYHLLPGYSLFRGHAKYLLTTALALSVLSGFGLDAVLSLGKEKLQSIAGVLIGAGLVGLSLFILLERVSPWTPSLLETWRGLLEWETSSRIEPGDSGIRLTWGYMLQSATWSMLFILVTGLWMQRLARPTRHGTNLARAGGVGLILIDLSFFGWQFFVVTPAQESRPARTTRAPSAEESPGWLRRPSPSDMPANSAMIRTRASAEGYVGNLPVAYSEFFRAAEQENPLRVDFTFRRQKQSPLSPLFGEHEALPGSSNQEGAERPQALPRAFLIHTREGEEHPWRPPVTDPNDYGLPPRPSLWPLPVESLSPDLPQPQLSEYGNHRIVFRAHLESDGFLILTDTFYPGWQARIDGDRRGILPAYHAFRAVPVRRAERVVEFFYDPNSFRLGLAVSLVAVTAWFGFLTARFTRTSRPWSPLVK